MSMQTEKKRTDHTWKSTINNFHNIFWINHFLKQFENEPIYILSSFEWMPLNDKLKESLKKD